MGMPVNQILNSAAAGFALGAQQPISVDWMQAPFAARVAVYIPAGSSATYGVEWTADDADNTNITARWFSDSTLPAGQTASGTTSYTSPVQFVRVNIAALSGTLETKLVQGMQV